MDTSLLGKRKAPSSGIGADGHQALFASVPEVCWLLVSSFAVPPDAYNLCLSSKHFFGDNIIVGDTKPSASGGMDADDEGSAPDPVLATRLLRQSLLSSLGRVLVNSQSGITLESALALADLPEGSALIAGSTMVQACLGIRWESGRYSLPPDVDIYCSAQAAPWVRSWLVDVSNCMFVGFKDYRIGGMDDERLLFAVDGNIHHVEHWGSIAKNVESNSSWKDNVKVDGSTGSSSLKETNYYKRATEWGKGCQEVYVAPKWKNPYIYILGLDMGDEYGIKPKEGGDLPFDREGDGNIDLIVAKVDDEEEIAPFDVLEDFDLTICKASFDGKKFRIPDPHRTFNSMSTMEPVRRSVVECYVNHFKCPEKKLGPIEQSKLASDTIEAMRRDIPRVPASWPHLHWLRYVDGAEKIPDRYNGNEFGAGSVYDQVVQWKYAPPIAFHNWTKKLVDRLRKYQTRGIEVVNAPTIANDYSMPRFDSIPVW